MTTPFTDASFQTALASLTSLAPSSAGIEALRRISAATDSDLVAFTAACLEHGVLDWLLRSLEYCGDADEPKRSMETLWVFTNLAVSSSGCTALLERGVAEKLCCVLHLGQPDDIVENAIWTLGNIAGEGRAAVDSLVERGVFAHVSRFLAEVDADADADAQGFGSTGDTVQTNLMWTVSNFTRVKPPLPYALLAPVVPLLARCLQRFERNGLRSALVDVLWSLTYVFREESEGVRFEDLIIVPKDKNSILEGSVAPPGDGDIDFDNILSRVVRQLHGPKPTRTPALRLLGNVAALEGGGGAAFFTSAVVAHLRRLAEQLDPDEMATVKELAWLVSNLLADCQETAACVLVGDVLSALIPQAPVLQRDGNPKSGEWSVGTEISWVLANAMDDVATGGVDGGRGAVAQLLLGAGALEYCAQAIAAAATLKEPPPSGQLGRFMQAVAEIIRVGDTSPDPAVLTEGARPRNEALAVFLAADGHSALLELLEDSKVRVTMTAWEETMQLVHLVMGIIGDFGVPQDVLARQNRFAEANAQARGGGNNHGDNDAAEEEDEDGDEDRDGEGEDGEGESEDKDDGEIDSEDGEDNDHDDSE